MKTVVDNPRELARARAARSALGLGRLLMIVALGETLAAIVRAVLEPEPSPIVLVHLAAVTRAAFALSGALLARGLVPYARALAIAHWAHAAIAFFSLSLVLSLLPLFALVPEALGDATWDALLQVGRVTTLVSGMASCLLVARAFADRVAHPLAARHMRWTVMPLIVCLPVALQAIDPALVPSVWIGPALAIALPWAMVLVHLMRWDVALWTLIGMLALAGTVAFSNAPGPLVASGIALAAVLLLASIAASGALHELAPQLGARTGEGVSRTLIRRLFDGTLGGEGSRVGDLDVEATPVDEQADEAAHLARVYHELGISPPPQGEVAIDPAGHAPLEPPRDVAPLVPISREVVRPHPAEVVLLPSAFASMHDGLRWCFASFVARVLVVVFGLLLGSSPLADMTFTLTLFDLALVASGLPLALGLARLRKNPLPATHPLATTAFASALALTVLDLALAVTRPLAPELRPVLVPIDGLLGVLAIGAMLATLTRLFAHRGDDKLVRRARNLLALLASWALVTAATVAIEAQPESDLAWLSWPLGFAAAAIGLGLWIALLWFVRDSQEAIDPHGPPRP